MADALHLLTIAPIAGYSEVLKKEAEIRERAFKPHCATIGGVVARALTPELLMRLEVARNGFVVPCRFDSLLEKCAHAMQFVWAVSEEYVMPDTLLARMRGDRRRKKMIAHLKAQPAQKLFGEIREYMDEAFYDGPRAAAGDNETPSPAYACWLAILIDSIVAGGYGMTPDKIKQTPFAELWQYQRLSSWRLYPTVAKRTNPSDRFAINGGLN